MFRCLLFIVAFCMALETQTQTSSADDVEGERTNQKSKPSLLAVSLPTAFHVGGSVCRVYWLCRDNVPYCGCDIRSVRYNNWNIWWSGICHMGWKSEISSILGLYFITVDIQLWSLSNLCRKPEYDHTHFLSCIIVEWLLHEPCFWSFYSLVYLKFRLESSLLMHSFIEWICIFRSTLHCLFLSRNHPKIVLSDFLLPGPQFAAASHNISLLLFSVESAANFLPSRFSPYCFLWLDSLMDRFRYMQVKRAVDHYSSFLSEFTLLENLSISDAFLLYSTPIFFVDVLEELLNSTSLSFVHLPSNWLMIGPLCLNGFISPEWSRQLSDFFSCSDITSRIVVYMGTNNGFDAWQLKSIIGGLQDPSTQVLIVGPLPKQSKKMQQNVLFVDSTEVSVFSLFQTYSITAVISYCDSLLVQAALYHSILLLCIPSLRNQHVINWLLQKKGCVVLPEGFWTESTVRDSLRQLMNLERLKVKKSTWNMSYQQMSEVELLPQGCRVDNYWVEVILMRVLGLEMVINVMCRCLVAFLVLLKLGSHILNDFRRLHCIVCYRK